MKIGYAICGSFCTIGRSLELLEKLATKHPKDSFVPIFSEHASMIDTRFGSANDFVRRACELTGSRAVLSIVDAEPLGPREPLDLMIVCPCTGNTLAKASLGITDTTVTMAIKAHLRGDRPLVIALASNDALSSNLKNISVMLSRKNVYFVPMRQDSPIDKPHSLVAELSELEATAADALCGKQRRKLFL